VSIKKETLSGLIWTFADTFILRGGTFIASLILARILGPKEFGLIGMITIFVAIGTSLVDSGMSSSIIRTKDADDKDFSTVFYTNLVLSILIYGIVYFTALFIALFYKQEILTSIIRWYCLSFIVSSLSSIQIAILTKRMQFKKIMICNIPGILTGIIVGITLGYLDYGVWSIVAMYLLTQVLNSITLWFFSDWRPSLKFSIERLKFHFTFGYKLMLSGLLNTVFNNIYNVIIGKYYSVQTLGYYERANLFNQYPVTTITGIVNRVTYPLLSKIQDQQERVSVVYKKLIQLTFFITAPLMFGAAAVAKPLFLLVLGAKWLPAVPFFQILCLSSIFLPIHSFNINVLKVYGRSDLFLKLEIIKKAVIAISVIIALQIGIYGLVWSSVFTSVVALLINTHYSSSLIRYTTKEQIQDIIPTLIQCVIMFALMSLTLDFMSNYNLMLQLFFPALLGLSFYTISNYLIKAPSSTYLLNLIVEKRL